MKWTPKTKRLDASHLTQEERKEYVRVGLVAMLAISFGLIIAGFFHQPTIGILCDVAGACIVSFIWGSIGTLEEERAKVGS